MGVVESDVRSSIATLWIRQWRILSPLLFGAVISLSAGEFDLTSHRECEEGTESTSENIFKVSLGANAASLLHTAGPNAARKMQFRKYYYPFVSQQQPPSGPL